MAIVCCVLAMLAAGGTYAPCGAAAASCAASCGRRCTWRQYSTNLRIVQHFVESVHVFLIPCLAGLENTFPEAQGQGSASAALEAHLMRHQAASPLRRS